VVKPHKATHTSNDTIIVTRELVAKWGKPPFQREVRGQNEKMRTIIAQIKADEVIPGVLTLGLVSGRLYLVDGQHRIAAFLLSEVQQAFADVRTHHVNSMDELADEFLDINSAIVKMKPDDIMRAMEALNPAISTIRTRCPFVGYDQIRRGPKTPVLSMTSVVRCWNMSGPEVPASSGGASSAQMAKLLTEEDAAHICDFLGLAFAAWGHDAGDVQRVWSNLNLTLCMWLYRRIVLTAYSPRIQRVPPPLYGKLLVSLTADDKYIDYLAGRQLTDKHRAPTYNRLKAVFVRRLQAETGKKVVLPAPSWAHG
jgi:hypothetical protein